MTPLYIARADWDLVLARASQQCKATTETAFARHVWKSAIQFAQLAGVRTAETPDETGLAAKPARHTRLATGKGYDLRITVREGSDLLELRMVSPDGTPI